MENELRIIEGLSLEQLLERAQALELEADYWRHLIDDGAAILDAVHVALTAVREATAACMILTAIVGPEALTHVETVIERQRRTLAQLEVIANTLDRVVDLADGRGKALAPVVRSLRIAAGLEVDGESE